MAVISSIGYKVVTGNTSFNALSTFLKKNKYGSYFILCDENTLQHCLPALITSCTALASAEVIEIESGEESKSLEFTANILQTLIENKAGKNTLFINLGGGVVSDLGGFVSSIYKRGIDFINIPTSLLAMADASVGGKTGIDFAGIKNSVGTITQPKAVFVNPLFLKTLPQRHYNNGLAEIYKMALVSNSNLWQRLKKQPYKQTEQLITSSIRLKNTIVVKDPLDKGIRKCLNFGHTIGHALEALLLNTKHELLHGEAVVIGMIAESHLAFQKKLISKALLTEITQQLQAVFELKLLPEITPETLMEIMQQDKKNVGARLQFALICGIGKPALNVEANKSQVKKALDYYQQLV